MRFFLRALLLLGVSMPQLAFAHCPLCTLGTGMLAVAAASLGFSSAAVGILTGAFALAMGIWMARLVSRKLVPYQDQILALLVYLTTVIPLMPLAREYAPLYVALSGGPYGTLLHRTYTIDLYLLGALVGAGMVLAAPALSTLSTRLTGHKMPYQRLVTLGVLLVAGIGTLELLIR